MAWGARLEGRKGRVVFIGSAATPMLSSSITVTKTMTSCHRTPGMGVWQCFLAIDVISVPYWFRSVGLAVFFLDVCCYFMEVVWLHFSSLFLPVCSVHIFLFPCRLFTILLYLYLFYLFICSHMPL